MFEDERENEVDTAHGIWVRLRRMRTSPKMRELVSETRLHPSSFVQPLFVRAGVGIREPIPTMPGQYRYSVDRLVDECREIFQLGIPAVLLFGIPDRKDDQGSEAANRFGVVQHAIREIKAALPELIVISDVCLCGYTAQGHCGVLRPKKAGEWDVDNDRTIQILGEIAISHAEAGADVVAPSAMMDGQVGLIRDYLNHQGFSNVSIMSYSAKFASGFYGPFRVAADSAPSFGDRKTYQMDPGNFQEAMREIEMDLHEGADIVMIKPALAFLDIIHAAKERFDVPVAAYNVSGEYSMVKAAAEKGWLDEGVVSHEILTSMKRAGASILISYFAKSVAEQLQKKS